VNSSGNDDPLYTDEFESIVKAAGVEAVKLPPRSPNLNAHAERSVRSIKEECLNHFILNSLKSLVLRPEESTHPARRQ
jgi:putative transposase